MKNYILLLLVVFGLCFLACGGNQMPRQSSPTLIQQSDFEKDKKTEVHAKSIEIVKSYLPGEKLNFYTTGWTIENDANQWNVNGTVKSGENEIVKSFVLRLYGDALNCEYLDIDGNVMIDTSIKN